MTRLPRTLSIVCCLSLSLAFAGCGGDCASCGKCESCETKDQGDKPTADPPPGADDKQPEPKSDGDPKTNAKSAPKPEGAGAGLLEKNLDGWDIVKFGGEGEVSFKEGVVNIDYGSPLSAIKYNGDLKELLGESLEDYTIKLEAKRVEGADMFLGFTFPVGTAGHVSLVLGGWGGATTGISNLDGLNASENDTGDIRTLNDNQWYRVTIQVTPDKINCWLDDTQIVDVKRSDYKQYTTHSAVEDTVPFGIFTYDTWGAYRNLRVWKAK